MKPIVYQNVEGLSYGELLIAISNIKNVIREYTSDYYKLLVAELDKRQKEI